MQKVGQNKEEAHAVARRLLDSKRQELKDGVLRKDMSLLGLSLPFCFLFVYVIVEDVSPVRTFHSTRTRD